MACAPASRVARAFCTATSIVRVDTGTSSRRSVIGAADAGKVWNSI
jgi:hypothetical protein